MRSKPASDTGLVRVLFINTSPDSPLGADTWVQVQVMADLDRATHEVHTACKVGRAGARTPTYEALRHVPDVRVVDVDLGPELYLRSAGGKLVGVAQTLPAVAAVARLVAYVRRHGISVIHSTDRPRDAAVAVVVARLTGAKSIVHLHVGYAEWMTGLRRWSLGHADAVIAVSDFVAGTLPDEIPGARVHTVLNAIDMSDWTPGECRDAARAEFGIGADAPVLIAVCRLFPAKGAADLLRSLALVHSVQPEAHLLVVGDDGDPNHSYIEELEHLASALGVREHVVFTGRRKDVPRLMAAADLFTMPSFGEPFGLVYLEAMAMRLPVVALDNGGTPEVVEHGRSGLLSAPGDIEGFAGHVIELLGDRERRGAMGDYGRAVVKERFTTTRMADDVAAVYRRVLS